MGRDEALRLLAEHRQELARFHVTSLAIFESVARGDAGPDSDVDILVEFDGSKSVGLFAFLELKECLERILGVRVDLGMPGALKPRMRERALKEAIPAV